MTLKIEHNTNSELKNADLTVLGCTQVSSGKKTSLKLNTDLKAIKTAIEKIDSIKTFEASLGTYREVTLDGQRIVLFGLGASKELTKEKFRRNMAKCYRGLKQENISSLEFDVKSLSLGINEGDAFSILAEACLMADYEFDKYRSSTKKSNLKKVILRSKKVTKAQGNKKISLILGVVDSVNVARDFINEVPNVLNSEKYASLIDKDVKTNLKGKGVKVKILNKAQIKKESMNLFLSVNSGSAYEPRLVHLTYTPKKSSSKTKHIALVGKGITFDTGGYSLKPSASMAGMKFDMGGSATVYGAFRAAVLSGSPYKLSCVLAMTDNAVNSKATFPDAVVKGRNGKTVEILNTDAEGRLILADALDYTSDQKPNVIIDAATLTGACLVALGKEVCAAMTNSKATLKKLMKSAEQTDEYLWELPIVEEFRNSLKSKVADLRNIGSGRFAGTPVAGAFLEEFVQEGIDWIHLDIAGVCDSQDHLPYCPSTGASGLMVRTLNHFLTN